MGATSGRTGGLVGAIAAARDLPPADRAALEQQLQGIVAAARAAWPDVTLEAHAFVEHLAAHLPAGAGLADALGELRASDLYLACACARGDAAAIASFEETLMSRAPAVIARIDRSPAFVAEVMQLVRVRLLVGDGASPPKIASYAGRASLASWLRATLLNESLMQRRGPRQIELDSNADHHIPVRFDAHLELARARHGRAFQIALDAALRELSPPERNLLRGYFADHLTIDQLGARFRVHRATAARRVNAALAHLLDETRRRLSEELKLTASEFDSLAHAVRSQLSLGDFFRS